MAAEPIRALIAEDDTLVADVIADELERVGVVVVGRATDGRQAVELTCSLRPDVVFMDLQMPELNGIEAAAALQERCPTPVVVLTVEASGHSAEEAARAGVGAYLVKPATGPELGRAVTIARRRFADLQELRRVNDELRGALSRVKTLSGLLPICASCKRIRDEHGQWLQVEVFVRERSTADFSHGVCPECLSKLYPPDEYPYLYDGGKTAGDEG